MIEAELVYEELAEGVTRNVYSLTPKGEKVLECTKKIIPDSFALQISDLKDKQREKADKIISSLRKEKKLTSELMEETGMRKKELNLYTLYLQATGYIDTKVEQNKLYHVLINDPENSENE